jgi:hypothetical protein
MTQRRKLMHNPLAAWTEIDGEIVVISPQDSVLHELNGTGSFIWRHVDGQRSAGDIAGLMASEFEVTPEQARADTDEFIAYLVEKKLLVREHAAAEAKSVG